MKRMLSIGLLLLSLLAACDGNKQVPEPEAAEPSRSIEGPSSALSAIDSLMWRQPDSALACLLPYFDTCGDVSGNVYTPYDRHYANLLLAELLYKNDYAQTNRRELLQAIVYLDSLILIPSSHTFAIRRHCGLDPQSPKQNNILPFLDARAHYINGVGYYEHDSVVEACREYMQALAIMDDHFKEKDLTGHEAQFMALNYTRLTALFSDLYLHEQAIYFGKESLHYYNKYEASPVHIGWALNEIGLHYDILERHDSAYYYYNQGINVVSDTTSLMYRDIAAGLAFLSYKQGKPIESSLGQLHSLLAQADSEKEHASRCLTIGEILYHEHQFDTAWFYLNMVYNQTPSVGAKKQAAEWLAEIAEAQGRNAEAFEYASFLVPFANVEENQSGIKTQLTLLYNDFKQARIDYQLHKETQKRIQLGLTVFGVLFLLLFFLLFKSIKHKKSLETERHAHQMQQAALAGRLKRSNANLKEQKKRQTTAPPIPSPHYLQSVDDYPDEPICKHIFAVCNDRSNPIKSTVPVSAYANIALSDIQKAQLKEAAMQHYGPLFETLKHQHPELKEKDFFYCYLCLLGLDNVQIAALQQNSISTIWDRESRLKKIFGSKDKVSVILYRLMNN